MGTRAHIHARRRQQPWGPLRRSRPSRRRGENVQPCAGREGEGMGTRSHIHARHRQQPHEPLRRSRPSRRCAENVLPCMAGFEKAWGPDHTSTLDTVNNLGILYTHQGHLEDAERMYNRALAGYEKAWGPNHTSMLRTVNNLRIFYTKQGHPDDAERMYNRLKGKNHGTQPSGRPPQ